MRMYNLKNLFVCPGRLAKAVEEVQCHRPRLRAGQGLHTTVMDPEETGPKGLCSGDSCSRLTTSRAKDVHHTFLCYSLQLRQAAKATILSTARRCQEAIPTSTTHCPSFKPSPRRHPFLCLNQPQRSVLSRSSPRS